MGRHSGLKSKWILADRASQEPFAAVSESVSAGISSSATPGPCTFRKISLSPVGLAEGATYQRLLDQIERDR
jgi:hypothetical protein